MREASITILKKNGYDILRARNGREALELYRKNQEKIKIVITDLDMPVMGGEELCRRLVKIAPDVKIVWITGFLEQRSKKELRRLGVREVVIKPFTVKELMTVVRSVLDRDRENAQRSGRE